jgi:DNA-binding transcriptional MerR regulator/effector-binding domain-containing protein
MFRIGIFAAMNKVTVKTLRYYDEEGLLKPAKIDDWTNYRYYSAEQMIPLRRILALKEMGFSIKEIPIISNEEKSNAEFIDYLRCKRKEASEKLINEKERVKSIDHYIQVLEKENKMSDYNVITKELPTVMAACVKTQVPNYDAFFKVVPPMGEIMKRQGGIVLDPEYCFTIFHDGEYKQKDLNVEICEAVVEAKKNGEGIVYREVQGGLAACVLHKGPYKTIGAAYEALTSWIEQHNYEASEPPRESYIDGIWNKDLEDNWLTEVQIPIKK